MGEHLRTELVIEAVEMVLWQRRPRRVSVGVLGRLWLDEDTPVVTAKTAVGGQRLISPSACSCLHDNLIPLRQHGTSLHLH